MWESEEMNMSKYYYNADGKSKEEIMNEFVRICKVGTSRDCRIVVDEAKRHGISYEELCEYKRNISRWKHNFKTKIERMNRLWKLSIMN